MNKINPDKTFLENLIVILFDEEKDPWCVSNEEIFKRIEELKEIEWMYKDLQN